MAFADADADASMRELTIEDIDNDATSEFGRERLEADEHVDDPCLVQHGAA